MAFLNVPWAVGGGAHIGPEVARILANGATGGASGVVSIGDLVVQPLATPGASVRIAPGAFVAASHFSGANRQSYVGFAPSETVVPIPVQGSSGARVDLLIAEIVDPQYVGSAPSNPDTFEYARPRLIQGISAASAATPNAALAYLKTQGITGVPLARINMPASTGTVGGGAGNGTITNLRELVSPRQRRVLHARSGTTTDPDVVLNSAVITGEYWPQFSFPTEVPEWATSCKIIAMWQQILVPANSGAAGYIRASIGADGDPERVMSQENVFDFGGISNTTRQTLVCADTVNIPANIRGDIKGVHLRGRYGVGAAPAVAQRIKADHATSLSIDLQFEESAGDWAV